mgnify:CR=1 FL=1
MEDANLGLLTFNAEYLPQKFAAYQEKLQLEILARDELVAVVNNIGRLNRASTPRSVSAPAFAGENLHH